MKLDFQAIERYAKQYAAKVCDDFFNRNNTISGQQIMKLSNVAQVNTFVIGDLYETWKSNTESFKSPYFNFENEEVKAALQAYMNTVSHHISVDREHFEPLLVNAVKNTIGLLLDPSKYFDDFVRESPEFTLTKDRIITLAKYTKINSVFAKGLKDKIADENHVYVTTALGWLNDLANHHDFENPDKYLEMLNATLAFKRDDFYKKSATVTAPSAASPRLTQSFFDVEHEDEDDAKTEVSTVNEEEEHEPLPTVAAIQAQIDKEGTPADIRIPSKLNDAFTDELPTVNDLLRKEVISQGTPLSDLAFNRQIKSIADAISLNQKFIFIGKLFEGDVNAYTRAVEDLDRCTSYLEAKNIMNKVLAPKFNWVMAAEEANDFLEIVGRKFQGL
ncbi:hypothetical protein [Flectobacillus sp. BAB-3569]|jgi:hypothetical protein|uniref:hypothetical protein n=1 Tax=Flectobacillus sp. BAB-3569 TaxID=1509483 RepID=UPI000BA41C7D|nr:hypothetical protein [Flectobacillus sp. BAB-3569]NBA77547.1 hypothetical protein [Emticicia sp. ODNR4P]PAC33152.1 hypothetical protein BWI92_01155 [Flectobacillus sp. BAB-3569]